MWSCEIPVAPERDRRTEDRYLPGLCDGSLIGSQGMTEPGSGSDAFALRTAASRIEGGYVLNGARPSSRTRRSRTCSSCSRRPTLRGFASTSAFLVDRTRPGLSVGEPFHKMGLRTSPMSEVVFDECVVPEESLLGPEARAWPSSTRRWTGSEASSWPAAVGTMQRQVDACVAYARERRQFGEPIGKFQAVSHTDRRHETATGDGSSPPVPAGGAEGGGELIYPRLRPGEAPSQRVFRPVLHGCPACSRCLRVHDGVADRADLRDALAARIYSGTSDIQRNIVAAYMGM